MRFYHPQNDMSDWWGRFSESIIYEILEVHNLWLHWLSRMICIVFGLESHVT